MRKENRGEGITKAKVNKIGERRSDTEIESKMEEERERKRGDKESESKKRKGN